MKTTSATIKLYLRVAKKLSDGSHPIMLKVSWKGAKELSTGFSCIPRFWDAKRECVKKGYPNYVAINTAISKLKMDAIARRDKFESEGVVYTALMVLKEEVKQVEEVIIPKDNMNGMIARYTVSLSPTTCKVWKAFWNSFQRYVNNEDISVNEISLETVKGYAKFLEDSGMKESTIKMTLSKLAAILKFCIEEGVISETPFKRFNYGKKYKTTAKLLYVHKKSIDVMKDMLLEKLIIRKGNMWTYRDENLDDFVDRSSDLFVLAFYLFGYTFQGLSPIDLCQLKVRDMSIVEKNDVKYYAWDTKRQKTGVKVSIRIPQNVLFNQVLVKTMLMFRKGEYLLPILDGVENDHLKRYDKVRNWLSNHADVLREWFKKVNERIIQMNVDDESKNIPLINEKCSFYSYRDSFAMAYLSTPNSSPVALATLMGRSPNTLASYISHLTSEDDLVDAVSII